MQAWTDGLVRQLHRKKLEVCHACFSGLPYMGSDHLICFNEPSRPWLISSFALVPKLRQSSTRLFSFDLRKMFGALPFRVLRQWILTQSLIAPTSSRCSDLKSRNVPHCYFLSALSPLSSSDSSSVSIRHNNIQTPSQMALHVKRQPVF